MEELNVEQTAEISAQPAEAEKENGAKNQPVSYGKFKDADALFKAYNALHSEFTKRCQRIKELESATAVDKEQSPTEHPLTATEAEVKNSADKENVLKEYLKEVLGAKCKAIVLDGNGVEIKNPPARPETIEQAGNLAKEIFGR